MNRELTPTIPAAAPTDGRAVPARLAQVRLTRAHQALQHHEGFLAGCADALQSVASRLQGHLGQPVEASARTVGAAIEASGLRDRCAWALFELADAQAHACLEVDLPFLCGVLDAFAAGGSRSHAATQLTRVEEAALGFLALQVVAALREEETIRCRLGPGLSGITLDRQLAQSRLSGPLLGVELQLEIGDLRGEARLLVPSRPLEAALLALPARFAAPNPEHPGSLGVVAVAGRTSLEADSVSALGRGDVILLDGLAREGDGWSGEARLEAPAFTLHGQLRGQSFHHQRASAREPNKEQLPMNDPNDSSALPVDLEVELCRCRLPVGELAGLEPGSLIGLRVPATEPVTLRIGDRAFARAELVEIEGQLGARILELLGTAP